MYPFAYHRPHTLAEAVACHQAAVEPRYLAGGQTLLPSLKLRLAQVSDVIDIARIAGLAGISATEDTVRIGAMTCHADVAASPIVRTRIPALAQLAGGASAIRRYATVAPLGEHWPPTIRPVILRQRCWVLGPAFRPTVARSPRMPFSPVCSRPRACRGGNHHCSHLSGPVAGQGTPGLSTRPRGMRWWGCSLS